MFDSGMILLGKIRCPSILGLRCHRHRDGDVSDCQIDRSGHALKRRLEDFFCPIKPPPLLLPLPLNMGNYLYHPNLDEC